MLICSLITVLDGLHPRQITSRAPPAASNFIRSCLVQHAADCQQSRLRSAVPQDTTQLNQPSRRGNDPAHPADGSSAGRALPPCCRWVTEHLQSVSRFRAPPGSVCARRSGFCSGASFCQSAETNVGHMYMSANASHSGGGVSQQQPREQTKASPHVFISTAGPTYELQISLEISVTPNMLV